MRHWLMKTEPSTFGLETLAAAQRRTTGWDGVRNYQVRNMIRDEMKKGDLAFLYHSSCALPGIVATMKIVRAGYPDPTAFDRKDDHYDPDSDPADPRWYMVDVQLQKPLARPVSLEELRAHAHRELKDMVLLRPGNRLSITPVAAAHWKFILALA
ncbi:MAG TPA: EVE domain-containing protein [Steroidobacteraceae bacterium]|jgi:predicted RNA-binding protein with PUA-like domain